MTLFKPQAMQPRIGRRPRDELHGAANHVSAPWDLAAECGSVVVP